MQRDGELLGWRGARSSRGVVSFESAVLLLPFFMLFMGAVEMGRLFYVQHVLSNAAREGASFAVRPLTGTDTLPSSDQIKGRVRAYLSASTILSSDITIAVDPNEVRKLQGIPGGHLEDEFVAADTYTRVRVTARYQFFSLAMFQSMGFTVTREALMRNETSGATL